MEKQEKEIKSTEKDDRTELQIAIDDLKEKGEAYFHGYHVMAYKNEYLINGLYTKSQNYRLIDGCHELCGEIEGTTFEGLEYDLNRVIKEIGDKIAIQEGRKKLIIDNIKDLDIYNEVPDDRKEQIVNIIKAGYNRLNAYFDLRSKEDYRQILLETNRIDYKFENDELDIENDLHRLNLEDAFASMLMFNIYEVYRWKDYEVLRKYY